MLEELRGKLYSTVVGSFPYKVSRDRMKGLDWGSDEEIRSTSHRALALQLECGIEFPSDGQFFDMIDMYLQPLMETGFLNRDRSLGDGEAPERHPLTALEAELEEKARGQGAVGLRVPITGPFTLAYRVKSAKKSLMEEADHKGVVRITEAVAGFCEGFDRALRESILSVDEPVLPFTLPVFGEEFVRETLNSVFEGIERNHSCMHVCGAIKNIKELALSLDVEILDHEFQGTDNSGVYSKEALESSGKILSYGILNTNPRQLALKDGKIRVESQEELIKKLEEACAQYGLENLMVSPDCGFGGWKSLRLPEDEKWKAIREKLANMVKARNALIASR